MGNPRRSSRHNSNSSNRKRSFQQEYPRQYGDDGLDVDNDGCVDDLAHAATFAIIQQPTFCPPPPQVNVGAPATVVSAVSTLSHDDKTEQNMSQPHHQEQQIQLVLGSRCDGDDNEIDVDGVDDDADNDKSENGLDSADGGGCVGELDENGRGNDQQIGLGCFNTSTPTSTKMDEEDPSDGTDDNGGFKTTEDCVENDDEDNNDDDSDDGDDDQSDVDLAVAARQIKQLEKGDDDDADDDDYDDDDSPIEGFGVSAPPKTEHELDAYRMPIHELEEQLQIQLSVDQSCTLFSAPSSTSSATKGQLSSPPNKANGIKVVDPNQLSIAGTIKHFMVAERTVVVESAASNAASASEYSGPLDEGSLLVFRKPISDSNIEGVENQSSMPSQQEFVLLGRIFEVFGPVSRPLYTIRLPQPPASPRQKQKATPKSRRQAKESIDVALQSPESQNEPSRVEQGIENKAAPENSVAARENLERSAEGDGNVEINTNQLVAVSNGEDDDDSISPPMKDSKAIDAVSDDSTDKKEEEDKSLVDPWAPEGELTKFLKANPNMSTFFISDEARLIDTRYVMRVSGKGCDASNLYDEEVTNSNEMYYSDDEKERDAKSKKKRGGNGKRNTERNKTSNHDTHQNDMQRRHGYHQQRHSHSLAAPPAAPPPPPPPRTHLAYHPVVSQAPVPQGFHQIPPPPPPLQGFQQYAYPPPPPPPPRQYYQQQPHPGAWTWPSSSPSSSSPRNPNEPPAYQY